MNKHRNFAAGGDGRIMLDLSTGSYDFSTPIILIITIRLFSRKLSVEEIKLISGTTTASLPISLRQLRDYPNQREQQEALADVRNVLDKVHPHYPPADAHDKQRLVVVYGGVNSNAVWNSASTGSSLKPCPKSRPFRERPRSLILDSPR